MFCGSPSPLSHLPPAVSPDSVRLAEPFPSFRTPRTAGTPFDLPAHRRSPKPPLSAPIRLLTFNAQLLTAASTKPRKMNPYHPAQPPSVKCSRMRTYEKWGGGWGVIFSLCQPQRRGHASLFLTMRPIHVYFYFSWNGECSGGLQPGHSDL